MSATPMLETVSDLRQARKELDGLVSEATSLGVETYVFRETADRFGAILEAAHRSTLLAYYGMKSHLASEIQKAKEAPDAEVTRLTARLRLADEMAKIDDGKLWSFLRDVFHAGADFEKNPPDNSEQYHAFMDGHAAMWCDEFRAKFAPGTAQEGGK